MKYALSLLSLALCLSLGLSPVRAEPVAWKVDPVHSALIFRVKHLNASWSYGRFNDFSGEFTVDDENLANAKIALTVQVASVDTGNEKRDQHLQSPDFFNVAQFPTMTFGSTRIRRTEGGYEVTGDLTLHGVKKSLTFVMQKVGEAEDPRAGRRIGFEGMLTLKRSEFGMTNMLQGVGDDIHIILAVEGMQG